MNKRITAWPASLYTNIEKVTVIVILYGGVWQRLPLGFYGPPIPLSSKPEQQRDVIFSRHPSVATVEKTIGLSSTDRTPIIEWQIWNLWHHPNYYWLDLLLRCQISLPATSSILRAREYLLLDLDLSHAACIKFDFVVLFRPFKFFPCNFMVC